MSARTSAWVPIHINDFMSATAHLTFDERAAYLFLLMHYWRRHKPLPNDDEKLARILQISLERWQSISDEVLIFFEPTDGVLTNKRMDQELQKAVKVSEKRRANGSKGGSKKQANAKQVLNKSQAIGTDLLKPGLSPAVDTCVKGQQTVGSQKSSGWQPDESTLKIMEVSEAEWVRDPACQEIRAKARKNAYRGVS